MKKTLKTGYKTRSNWQQRNTKFFPSINLSGDWLQDAGFNIGQAVAVEISQGQLIIKAL
ncbi:SymE family type I addiction module toxin [Runella slithyformis]|uniref:Toxin SymE-like domain-containing protein n=1 Tax=Runella slithyformis (strain ATCC 29530 / DSM 19594 / LMG 11500 / NCIMB 11436 / LSU 4) TaxID=761193 RepID=A0A7U3ZN50_RUNSL|nr:SymE family type I addiction module toxin [Runella slithyformis]AEI50254.1 Domain of unknown function DUF1813 HSP20 [Runella slithyformis DSM 19594]